jgi:hypothetical protein
MSELQGSDKSAAFKGLIVTAILLFALAFTIVKLTNHKYAGSAEARPGSTK